MTGQGCCIDNVFIERLWRSIKYEAIYLNEFDDFTALKTALHKYLHFYNYQRYHQALNYLTLPQVYFANSSNFKAKKAKNNEIKYE